MDYGRDCFADVGIDDLMVVMRLGDVIRGGGKEQLSPGSDPPPPVSPAEHR